MPAKLKGFLHLTVYRYLKTFIIMAKIDLKFLDTEEKDRTISVINFKEDECDEIQIIINSTNDVQSIYLDKSTAIKFAKTLRTEINKIVE